MTIVFICLTAVGVFVLATLALGAWLRLNPSVAHAEQSSRVIHLLFFVCLNFAPLLVFLSPGITRLDAVLGLPPLWPRLLWAFAGAVLLLPGVYLLATTNKALRALGHGANAFRLTKRVSARMSTATRAIPCRWGSICGCWVSR
jgi:hypothetical protein